MRLFAAGLVVLASGGVAAAADCNTDAATVTGRSATIFTDALFVNGGDSVTCTVKAEGLAVPAGHFGVYKVDSTTSTIIEDGDTVTYTFDAYGDSKQVVTVGPFDGSPVITQYFGAGPTGSFDAELGLALTGDAMSESLVEALDILVGYTTLDSQTDSLHQLSVARTGIVTSLNTTTSLILGGNQRTERPSEFAALGAAGSYTVGGYGHFDLGDGFSADIGAAAFGQEVGDGAASGVLLGGQARYLQPDNGQGMRWLGGVGLNASPDMSMTFTRSYSDGSPEGATVEATTGGSMVGIWLEGGVLVAPTPTDEIVFSASVGRNWLNTDGYEETLSDTNLFALSLDDATSTYDTIEAKAAWTTEITPDVDLTVHGAIGYLHANDDLTADVAFVDTLSVGGVSEAYVEYGARLGWSFAEQARWDVYAIGSTGMESGTHVQLGTAVSMKF